MQTGHESKKGESGMGKKRTLLDITEDMQALDDLLQDMGGDVSNPEVEATIDGLLAELDADLENKVDNYAALIGCMRGRAEIRKAEAKRLMDRVRVDENAAKGLSERLKYAFESLNLSKVETPRFRVSIAKNGGKAPLVIDEDALIPEEYQRIVKEPDKTLLREALEAGTEVAGVSLGDRGTRLSIR